MMKTFETFECAKPKNNRKNEIRIFLLLKIFYVIFELDVFQNGDEKSEAESE